MFMSEDATKSNVSHHLVSVNRQNTSQSSDCISEKVSF